MSFTTILSVLNGQQFTQLPGDLVIIRTKLGDVSFGPIELSLNSVYDSSLIPQINTYNTILSSISFSSIDTSLNSIYISDQISQLTSYRNILDSISFDTMYENIETIYDNSLSDIQTTIDTQLENSITIILAKANEATGHVNDIIGQINSININQLY